MSQSLCAIQARLIWSTYIIVGGISCGTPLLSLLSVVSPHLPCLAPPKQIDMGKRLSLTGELVKQVLHIYIYIYHVHIYNYVYL